MSTHPNRDLMDNKWRDTKHPNARPGRASGRPCLVRIERTFQSDHPLAFDWNAADNIRSLRRQHEVKIRVDPKIIQDILDRWPEGETAPIAEVSLHWTIPEYEAKVVEFYRWRRRSSDDYGTSKKEKKRGHRFRWPPWRSNMPGSSR